MISSVKEVGNVIPISSCRKDTTSGHPMKQRFLREVSLCKPHSISDRQAVRSSIESDVRLVGKPSFWKGYNTWTLV